MNIRKLQFMLFCFVLLFVLSVILSLIGCTKTVRSVEHYTDTLTVVHERTDTVVVQSYKTDTVHEYTHKSDSVYVRDSVYVIQMHDTLYYYKERWNNSVQLKHDTVYKHHVDTLIVYKYIQTADTANHSIDSNNMVVKEKKSWNWLSWVGLSCIVGSLLFLVMMGVRYFRR